MFKQNKDPLINNLQRCLKKNASTDKYINKLRNLGKINTFLKIGQSEMTLLMYYVKENQLSKVKQLLTGNNSADPTLQNEEGLNALALAVMALAVQENYDSKIIEELLTNHPLEQLDVMTPLGSVLYLAVQNNQEATVQKILEIAPKEILFKDLPIHFTSPLHAAVLSKNKTVIMALLKNEADKQLLQQDECGRIPLHLALSDGEQEVVQLLLQYIPQQQLIQKTSDQRTVFDHVADSGNIELVDWLITQHPEVLKLRSVDGFTPLHSAVRLKNLQLIQLLLKKGDPKQVLAKGDDGILPIVNAVTSDSVMLVNELLQYYPNEQLTAADDITATTLLHLCCIFAAEQCLQLILTIAKRNNIDIKPLLLKENNIGTPIFGLILSKHAKKLSMIEILLKVDNTTQLEYVTEKNARNALHCAVDNNEIEVVRLLLEKGSKTQLDQKYLNEVYPLEWALTKKYFELAQVILQFQTVQQLLIMNKVPPLLMAIALKNKNFFQALLNPNFFSRSFVNVYESHHGNTALHVAIEYYNYWALMDLLAKKIDVNVGNFEGWTPLHLACERGQLEFVHLLIQAGADIKLKIKGELGVSAAHIAALRGNLEVLKRLYQSSVEIINMPDNKGGTPLFCAIYAGQVATAEWLLQHHADPNTITEINNRFQAPLMIALQKLDLDSVKLLLSYKANLNQVIIKDKEVAVTILDYIKAAYTKSPEIYNTLKQIIPQLPSLKSEPDNNGNNSITVLDESFISPRRYLQVMGYSEEEIKQFEVERKENKRLLKQNFYKFQVNTSQPLDKKEALVTWLNGAISSDHPAVFRISSPENRIIYGYFDEVSLKAQDCDPSKLYRRRFKFDGYHFSKLNDNKNIYCEHIKFSEDQAPREITYTHEFKLNQLDRVLCFPLKSDKGEADIYIGIRYVVNGFHRSLEINALTQSSKVKDHYLEVHWPAVRQSNQENCSVKLVL